MNFYTREIIDVFHGYAFTHEEDDFARQHIHGLNKTFLKLEGYQTTEELVQAFRSWMRGKPISFIYGNNPAIERKELNLNIVDVGLDQWIDRINQPYHCIARAFKEKFIPICSKRCSFDAHSSFRGAFVRRNKLSDRARASHGFHCSLYDCYEMYLCLISTV